MCRLFGMSGGRERLRATFWLLEAPDSLAQQSRREPDGTGVGSFDEQGRPEVSKQPLAAYEDQQFAREARELCSRTFVAHVRYASNGAVAPQNTHPFEQHGRLFAHNGVIGDVPALERRLGAAMAVVHGETDSERYFALIGSEIDRTGDVGAGIVAAARWIAEHLPVFALNCVLISDAELWALRYPDTHELHVLKRAAGGPHGNRHLEHASARGSIRVRSGDLGTREAVVVASEPMDEDPGWRALAPGELLHVDAALETTVVMAIEQPPAHPLSLADLGGQAAASQRSS
ncbi:MAG: class II glutamine amidotransferase [Solirubrobacteraceae bacterium]